MLTERQELILKTIIQDFTTSHEPVGSKTVMNQLPIKVSSATIRNEMAALEEKGLLEKTHSSSGRIPSSAGYRYYLDNLVDPVKIPNSVYNRIIYQLDQPFNQVNEIVQEAAKILSDLTNYTAFAASPETYDALITGFRIVPLSEHQVMAILVTDDGNVKNQVYTLSHHSNGEEIEKAVRLINDQLTGKPLSSVSSDLLHKIANHLLSRGSAVEILDLLQDVVKDAASEQMYVDGQINLLNDYHHNDVAKIKSLYEMFDQSDEIYRLIGLVPKQESDDKKKGKVQVTLGPDLPSDLLKNYSLLTAQYSVGKYGKGTIALLGPTNMPYSQMIGLLDYFRNELARKLLDYYGRFR
ncbi:heat-inducible transcriptional repressor [Lactobacillus colini]|uniref:Heat-inducible transcription repressor HrcA n=1 Tax=Lactobacillus colini TaxID=1819254 RepID=A0ABS4MGX5_9LACO|nr:heat-inducible transcriptional repressor HrcA [Lactobacillus colini]MBP2058946.1 heat-inducible transcriptional repressor [Lactobacillus colini]